jgi:hydroxymethylbilane synthase
MLSQKSSVKIVVGARGSPLSRVQCEEVLLQLRRSTPEIEFVPLWTETSGDKDLSLSLRALGQTDIFTKEIDALLLKGTCRIAIHSAKDLPNPIAEGLAIVALTRGVDPSDSLVLREGETLQTLSSGAKIGVSSVRREKTILMIRPDLLCMEIRGTIGHRLSLLDQKIFDGVVMAEAALIRLGLTHRNRIPLPGEAAPLQGRLAVLSRKDDLEMQQLFAPLDARSLCKQPFI